MSYLSPQSFSNSKDEQKILSWSADGTVKLQKLYDEIDTKLQKEDYTLRVEVETGVRLNSSVEIEVLKAKEWREKKKAYEKLLEKLTMKSNIHVGRGVSPRHKSA